MHLINAPLRVVFDLLLAPFRGLPAWVALIAVSLVVAVGLLLIIKKTSNQAGVDAAKRRIHASLFEIRLFNDDLRAILRAQLHILRHNLTYLRYWLVPLLCMLPPLVLVMAQLQPHFGYRGLRVGEPVLVEVELAEGSAAGEARGATKPDLGLEVPQGLRLESPGVWMPTRRKMAWRMAAEAPGEYELGVRLGGEAVTKEVRVSDRIVRRSARRPSTQLDQFLYPGEPPLPAGSQIRSIDVGYPEEPEWLLAPRWMWIVLLLSSLFAVLLRNRFGVTL